MPVSAFVVYENAAPNLIRGFGRTQAQANARAGEDSSWTAHVGQVANVPTDVRGDGNWRFDVGTATVQRYDPVTLAQQVGLWKDLISERALIFDRGFKLHWSAAAHSDAGHAINQPIDDMAQTRLDNTLNWARSWIGMPWLEVLKYSGNAAALALEMGDNQLVSLSEDDVQARVDQCQAEFPNEEHIFFWYEGHIRAEDWFTYLDNRRIYFTLGAPVGAGQLVGARYWNIPQATWTALITTYYQDALRRTVGIAEGGLV